VQARVSGDSNGFGSRAIRIVRRPRDYIDGLLTDFVELHGDRRYADDGAIIAGMGYFPAAPGRRRGPSAGPLDQRSDQAQLRQAVSRGLIAKRRECSIWQIVSGCR